MLSFLPLFAYGVAGHTVLEHPDPKAMNTAVAPDRVVPHQRGDARWDGGRLSATLAPLSWNVIRLAALAT